MLDAFRYWWLVLGRARGATFGSLGWNRRTVFILLCVGLGWLRHVGRVGIEPAMPDLATLLETSLLPAVGSAAFIFAWDFLRMPAVIHAEQQLTIAALAPQEITPVHLSEYARHLLATWNPDGEMRIGSSWGVGSAPVVCIWEFRFEDQSNAQLRANYSEAYRELVRHDLLEKGNDDDYFLTPRGWEMKDKIPAAFPPVPEIHAVVRARFREYLMELYQAGWNLKADGIDAWIERCCAVIAAGFDGEHSVRRFQNDGDLEVQNGDPRVAAVQRRLLRLGEFIGIAETCNVNDDFTVAKWEAVRAIVRPPPTFPPYVTLRCMEDDEPHGRVGQFASMPVELAEARLATGRWLRVIPNR